MSEPILYSPLSLRRFYRKRVNGKPEKYSDLLSALERSRLRYTISEILAIAIFYPLLATVPGTMLGYLISEIIKPEELLVIRGFVVEYWKIQIALCAGFAILAFGFTRYLILSYPYYVTNVRKSKIDSSLPHAVNMMLGMAKGGVPLISIFKFIAENRDVFGEISREFERIVLLVDVFGADVYTAVKQVAETTPSDRLKTFLENFLNVYEGGGDVVEYLRAKSEQFLSERETYYTLFLETLQVFAEIYLALFIVAPLFFLTVLVVFQLVGGGALNVFKLVMYTFIPLGTLLVIWLIRSAIPSESAGFGEKREEVEILDMKIADRPPGFKVDSFRLRLRKIWKFLTRPFTEEVYTLTLRALSFYLILPAAIFFFLAYGKIDYDILIFATLSTVIFPSIVFIEYKERVLRKMEKELPEFLKQLASLNEAGLNVVEALRHLSDTELGILGREIRKIKREIEWGGLITSALEKIERRVKSPIFTRAISLLIRAIESTPSIREALITASMYSELEIEVRDRIRAQMSMYIIIIYLSFAVFLYTAYVLIQNMLSVFTPVEATPMLNVMSINMAEIKRTFLETSLIVGASSGVMAGLMGEGKLESGLKHVFILVVIVYVFFRFILP
ncbi:type II secretion system F family protein [Archaeoglobus neptunius]|uniref:type II secretion system F family protein n=1 Tax=Archaeoglobus neptunius TaxID=2798580 RepID=UPI0019275211|nr:type II secretion system F family protein [Archaeoglobus neptunius]